MLRTGYKAAYDRNELPVCPWDTVQQCWLGSDKSFSLKRLLLEPRQLKLSTMSQKEIRTFATIVVENR